MLLMCFDVRSVVVLAHIHKSSGASVKHCLFLCHSNGHDCCRKTYGWEAPRVSPDPPP